MIALLLGTLLAVLALAFVLYPLFRDVIGEPRVPLAALRPAAASSGESAVDALREIEFDRATGKLSDDDYAALKTRYTRKALDELRAAQAATASAGEVAAVDAAEAAVRAYRSQRAECTTCGPRPEPDAIYCSSCGRYLRGACGACGAPVDSLGAHFCTSCGHSLAA